MIFQLIILSFTLVESTSLRKVTSFLQPESLEYPPLHPLVKAAADLNGIISSRTLALKRRFPEYHYSRCSEILADVNEAIKRFKPAFSDLKFQIRVKTLSLVKPMLTSTEEDVQKISHTILLIYEEINACSKQLKELRTLKARLVNKVYTNYPLFTSPRFPIHVL
jgi:hypothetical protein